MERSLMFGDDTQTIIMNTPLCHNLPIAVRFTKQCLIMQSSPSIAAASITVSPQKRVRFSSQQDVNIPSPAPLENATQSELWYSADEMAAFEFEARQLSILVYRSLLQQHLEDTPALALGPHTRGLETRGCIQRQLLRRQARAYIRQIQQGRTADELAEVAREMNAWAKHLAYEEAARDFDRAYADESNKRKFDALQEHS
ncbi:hypothetical protein FisN_3Lh604 [Fistulifera solaris]|uniref:Uncharacterized protein n=1 Tax=Fistulifera solaris TaxID=1519565 RepID=A0A1Z5J8T2_FISSO|nr:hypothetical protein FisN_3Lh604 [Fistulifera solaris]|eukprot:GAX10385.1 hypothetical protein FisN_3Lh604 [Fistulifera solaris]